VRYGLSVVNATVHLLCGKTGSGKTTFARRLEQEQRAVLLSVDPG
jgi:predicted kinase